MGINKYNRPHGNYQRIVPNYKQRFVPDNQQTIIPDNQQRVIHDTQYKTVKEYKTITEYDDEITYNYIPETKYKTVTVSEEQPEVVTEYKDQEQTVTKTKTYKYSRPVVRTYPKTRTYSYSSYRYKLYIYMLYLEGELSYDDMVALIGEDSLSFDENGKIVLDYDSLDDIPSYIQVRGKEASSERIGMQISAAGDEIKGSNPGGFDSPVVDAGVVDVID